MKTYKHNNSELISEESLAILHKNAKNKRIENYFLKRKELRGKIFLYATLTLAGTLFVMASLMLG